MRILHITPVYPPQDCRIAEQVRGAAVALARQGHTVAVAALADQAAPPGISYTGGIKVRRFARARAGRAWAIDILRFLRREGAQFDIAHLHGYDDTPLWSLAALAFHGPVVLSPHYAPAPAGSVLARVGHMLARQLARPLKTAALPCITDYICASDAEKAALAADLAIVPARIHVVPPITLCDAAPAAGIANAPGAADAGADLSPPDWRRSASMLAGIYTSICLEGFYRVRGAH